MATLYKVMCYLTRHCYFHEILEGSKIVGTKICFWYLQLLVLQLYFCFIKTILVSNYFPPTTFYFAPVSVWAGIIVLGTAHIKNGHHRHRLNKIIHYILNLVKKQFVKARGRWRMLQIFKKNNIIPTDTQCKVEESVLEN